MDENKMLTPKGVNEVWQKNFELVRSLTGDVNKSKGDLQTQVDKLNEDLDNKLDNSTDVENAGKAVVVGEDGKLVFGEAATASSNPNLLDNGWFNVNSRGQNEYFGQAYALDRWYFLNGNRNISYLTVNNDGSVTFKNTSSGPIYMAQKVLSNVSIGYANCRLSVIDINDNIYVSTDTSGVNIDDMLLFYIDSSKNVAAFKIQSGCNITIKAAKLELGLVSTFHLDTAPNPEEEKLRCMLSTADPDDPFSNKKLQSAVGDEWDKDVVYQVGDMFIAGNTLWKTKVQHSGQIPVEGSTYVEKTSAAKELSKTFETAHAEIVENGMTFYLDKIGRFGIIRATTASGFLNKDIIKGENILTIPDIWRSKFEYMDFIDTTTKKRLTLLSNGIICYEDEVIPAKTSLRFTMIYPLKTY